MSKKILNAICLLFLGACLFAQVNENQVELTPSKIKEINSDKTIVEFKTDIPNVEVYLNGSFYGRTNLEITDLIPGIYSAELKLAGYESQKFQVLVKKGFAQTYTFEMKLIQGSVSLYNLPNGALVKIDDKEVAVSYSEKDTNVFYTTPGNHKVEVVCFGRKDFVQEVKVEAYADSSVQIEMPFAEFQISDFVALKPTFNPDYKGRLGTCPFTYKVTNDGLVEVEIFDSGNQLVWTKAFSDFTSSEQTFSWDGKSLLGNVLENGEYVVKLTSGNYEKTIAVTISRSIDYPLFTANATGSGVGPLPSVFGSKFDFFAVYLNAAPTTVSFLSGEKSGKNEFYGLGLNAGLIWDFANFYEVSGQLYTLPGHENGFVGRLNLNFKISNSVETKDHLTVSYGALLRVGFSTNAIYEPYGIDSGSGLIAPCGMIGVSRDRWSTCFSSQMIYSAATGSFKNNDWVWKNSISASFRPVKSLSVNGWLGLNSAFNLESFTKTQMPSAIFARGLNYGAGITWLPFSSTILINVNLDGNLIPNEANYISVQIGLSYLF